MPYDPNSPYNGNPYGAPMNPGQPSVPPNDSFNVPNSPQQGMPQNGYGQMPPQGQNYGQPYPQQNGYGSQIPAQNPYGQSVPQQGYPNQMPQGQGYMNPQQGTPNQNGYYGAPTPTMPPFEGRTEPEKNDETMRVERMRKRLFWLLVGLSLVVVAFLIWEVVDLIGGFH
ncbi:MAG: hypothetical protein ACI32C_01870 [Candidatus Enteromonas sp.]